MRCLVAVVLLALPGLAAAQRVLDFHDQLAFSTLEVNASAAAAYGARLRALGDSARLDADPALERRLQRIQARLARAAVYEHPAAAGLAWEIHACSRCDENASALPGGKLLISADFVARHALTDDELGYLLAHEVGHVLAQHARELATVARYFVDNGLAREYSDIQQELDQSLAVTLRMRPVHVQQELEADYIGFVLGAHAGFDPAAMLRLLDKLSAEGQSVLGTHPSHPRRLLQAREMLETARRLVAHPVE